MSKALAGFGAAGAAAVGANKPKTGAIRDGNYLPHSPLLAHLAVNGGGGR